MSDDQGGSGQTVDDGLAGVADVGDRNAGPEDFGKTFVERRLPGGSVVRATPRTRFEIEKIGGPVTLEQGAVWIRVPADHRLETIHGNVAVTCSGGSALVDVAGGGGLAVVLSGQVEVRGLDATLTVPAGHAIGFDTATGALKPTEALEPGELAADRFVALNLVLDSAFDTSLRAGADVITVAGASWRRRLFPLAVASAVGLGLGSVVGAVATSDTAEDPTLVAATTTSTPAPATAAPATAAPATTGAPSTTATPPTSTTTSPGVPVQTRVGRCEAGILALSTTGVITGGPVDTLAYQVVLGLVDGQGEWFWRMDAPVVVPVPEVGQPARWRGTQPIPAQPPRGSTCKVVSVRPLVG